MNIINKGKEPGSSGCMHPVTGASGKGRTGRYGPVQSEPSTAVHVAMISDMIKARAPRDHVASLSSGILVVFLKLRGYSRTLAPGPPARVSVLDWPQRRPRWPKYVDVQVRDPQSQWHPEAGPLH